MDWSFLSVSWITANWLPLVITLFLGFILGWLLTGISPRRRAGRLDAQVADLEAKLKKSDRDLADARKQADGLKANVSSTENALADARKQLADTQGNLQTLTEEKAAADSDLQSRNIESADLKMQLALLQDQYDQYRSTTGGDVEALRAGLDALTTENGSLKQQNEATLADLAALRVSADTALKSIASKDSALNEAYQRAVNLQRVMEDREAALASAQAELSNLKLENSALNNIRAELEDRLQRARGDVAGEMAVLTSTMIRMKEDSLGSAQARITELTNELNTLKSGQLAAGD